MWYKRLPGDGGVKEGKKTERKSEKERGNKGKEERKSLGSGHENWNHGTRKRKQNRISRK